MQRKVFRIEQMFADKRLRPAAAQSHARAPVDPRQPRPAVARAAAPDTGALQELKRELDMIYRVIDRNRRELASLQAPSSDGPRVVRAKHELGAAIGSMEKATQQILKAAETIDESARALHATLKNDYNRGLSQDIIDQVVRVYEACNFQDLSGQHIAKAMDTLKFIEDHVLRMVEIWGGVDPAPEQPVPDDRPLGRALVNGPRIVGDNGHVNQADVDDLFSYP